MTTIAASLELDRSLRAELKEFVERALAGEDEVSIEKLVRLAYREFSGDEWMREALIREGLAALIPEITADVKHEHRTRARLSKAGPKSRQERIASVFEHVGSGVSKSVLAMNRPDHLFAAEERRTIIHGHKRWMDFHTAVAKLHKDDTTTTGELPPAKVTELWKKYIEAE